jgi:RHS repeat-associated protein
LRLPGQENDIETGLYHNGFRDYIPGSGRYAESDPLGLSGGSNTYLYGQAQPADMIDVTGLSGVRIALQPNFNCNAFGSCAPVPDTHVGVNLEFTVSSAQAFWGQFLYVGADREYAVEGEESLFEGLGSISPRELALDIWNDPSYWPGDPVRLIICNSGKGGANSLAWKVANELGKLTIASGRPLSQSSTVSGPNGYYWPYFDAITRAPLAPFGASPEGGGRFISVGPQ